MFSDVHNDDLQNVLIKMRLVTTTNFNHEKAKFNLSKPFVVSWMRNSIGPFVILGDYNLEYFLLYDANLCTRVRIT